MAQAVEENAEAVSCASGILEDLFSAEVAVMPAFVREWVLRALGAECRSGPDRAAASALIPALRKFWKGRPAPLKWLSAMGGPPDPLQAGFRPLGRLLRPHFGTMPGEVANWCWHLLRNLRGRRRDRPGRAYRAFLGMALMSRADRTPNGRPIRRPITLSGHHFGSL